MGSRVKKILSHSGGDVALSDFPLHAVSSAQRRTHVPCRPSDSQRTPAENRITLGLHVDHASISLATRQGRQHALWYCGRKGCGPDCQHKTEADVLEQARKMVWL